MVAVEISTFNSSLVITDVSDVNGLAEIAKIPVQKLLLTQNTKKQTLLSFKTRLNLLHIIAVIPADRKIRTDSFVLAHFL